MGESARSWPIFHVFFFITFMVSGLCINAIQFTLRFTLGLVRLDLYRRINYYLLWLIYAQVVFLGTWWSNGRIKIHFRRDQALVEQWLGREHALVVMNHHYEIDWLHSWMVAAHFGVLGNARVFIKAAMRYLPILGWAWAISDVGFLHREWERDKDEIAQCVQKIETFPDPAWLLLFPEGTRITPEKLRQSQEYALAKGLTPFRDHLLPRTKGFGQIVTSLNPTKIPCIYDVTLVVHPCADQTSPTLSNILNGQSVLADVFVQRLPITEEVLKDPSTFLMDLFRTKDEMKARFHAEGQFCAEACTEVDVARQWSVLVSTLLCHAFVLYFGWYSLFTSDMLWNSTSLQVSLLAIFATLFFVMQKMIQVTKVKKKSE